MRYLNVLVCFLLVLSSAACTFDDGDDPNKDSATAEEGKDLVVDIGVARLSISRFAIGTDPGQLEPGSRVSMTVRDDEIANRATYSPVVDVTVKDANGDPVTGLNLAPAAIFELSYDVNGAKDDGFTNPLDLELLRIDGSQTDALTFTTAASPGADTNYVIAYPGRVRARLTGLSRFVMAAAESPGGGLPSPTALTGTVSTVLTSTIFQLADSGGNFSVNLAIPTADTTTPPTVLTLNDASFDSGNPTSPTNRILTVQTGGTTYTTDAPGASVVVQLDTFTGSGSGGSISGTVIEQGGSQTLEINFTFTTGTPPAVAMAGTITDIGGRRTISLQDAAGDEQAVIVMPDTFPNAGLDPITFDDSTFDSTNPTDPAGRIVTVTEGGETFSSDVPVVGDVTVTFTSFDDGTLVGQGTITGTVVSATPNTKTLNYTFDTTAGGGGGGGGFSAGTPVDVTTDQADESAVVFDGTDYVAIWLSDVGTTNRTLELQSLDPDTLATGTLQSHETTTGSMDPAAGFSAAVDASGNVMIVGATGTDDTADTVIGVIYDYTGGSLVNEFSIGTGTGPRVAYNAQANAFVVAYEASANVDARAYDSTGTAVAAAVTAINNASLKGLAAAGGANDEVLVTGDDGSGVAAQYVTPSTGALSGSNFDLSTDLSGGLCVWDEVGAQYIVQLQTLIQSVFIAQTVVALPPGATAIVGSELTLAAAAEMTQAVGGNAGTIFSDPGTNLYPVDSDSGGPAMVDNAIIGSTAGIDLDTTANGPALAAAGSNRYILIAARGGDGVTAIPLTLNP